MAYNPTTWESGDTVTAAALNTIEQGIAAASGAGHRIGVLVASADAPSSIKDTADYVCDGTGDQTQINSAIDDAAALNSRNSGMPAGAQQLGQVLLTGGRFNVSAPIEIRTAVSLRGAGWLTELRAVGNNGSGVVKLAAPDDHLCHVRDLWLNGNYGSGGSCNGVDFDMTSSGSTGGYPGVNPDSYHLVDNLLITGFGGGSRDGVYIHASGTANNRGNIVSNLQIRDCSGNGVHFSSASDSFISHCHVGGSGSAGLRVATGNTKVTACKSFYSDGYGFHFSSGRHAVTGCESQDDATGVYISSSDAVFTGIIADTAEDDCIVIDNSGVVLTGFQAFNRGSGRYGTTTNGIRFTGSHNDSMIVGRVKPNNITNPIVGSAGSRSFVRVSDGSTLVSEG